MQRKAETESDSREKSRGRGLEIRCGREQIGFVLCLRQRLLDCYLESRDICPIGIFFQAEDGIRDHCVTGVQTCSLFFSSRRRHTRSLCDWSSDVCSSDLKQKTAYEITV